MRYIQMTYQRKGNDNTSIGNIPQGNPSQKAKVSSNIDLNIDLRDGCRMKKYLGQFQN